MDEAPTEAFDLVFEWLERFRAGDTESLAWILTRPFTCDLRGTSSSREPLDLDEALEFSTALADAFPQVRVVPHRLEAREHRILARASLDALHAGPLDLSAFGLGRFEATGQSLDLGTQTVAWEIVHQRVHRFEVVDGPGLGPDLLLDRLDLASAGTSTPPEPPERSVNGSNGHHGSNGRGGQNGQNGDGTVETVEVREVAAEGDADGGTDQDNEGEGEGSQRDRHDAIAEKVDRLAAQRRRSERSTGDA